MHKALKPSLVYVVSMLVILLLLASYFFIQMHDSLTAGQTHEALLKEEATLRAQSRQLKSSIKKFENNLAALEQKITQKQSELLGLQTARAETDAECRAAEANGATAELQHRLAESETNVRTCETALQKKNATVDTLTRDSEAHEVTENKLASARAVIQTLRDELTQTRQQYDKQVQAARIQSQNDNDTRVRTQADQQAENALIRAREEIAVLETRLEQLQAKNDELEAATRSSGKLELTGFTATPHFCSTQRSGEGVCLASIDISATFNFSPSGFIAMIIFDPNGNIIGRESIAGRTINQVSFELDEKTPVRSGYYSIEFRVNDVFNRFSETKRFTVNQS